MSIITRLEGHGIGQIPGVKPLYDYIIYQCDIPHTVTGGQLYPIYDSENNGVCYYTKDYETPVVNALQTHTQPGDTVVDIGASIGYHTLAAAHHTTPRGYVHAYEPQPERYRGLIRNLDENNITHVTTHQHQLTRGDGHRIYAHEPDVIKMDVEGAEAHLLPALSSTMHDHRPVILVELHWPHLGRETIADIQVLLDRTKYTASHLETGNLHHEWQTVREREERSHYCLKPDSGTQEDNHGKE